MCYFCGRTFDNAVECDDHILEHFARGNCTDCNNELICIGNKWYQLHTDGNTINCSAMLNSTYEQNPEPTANFEYEANDEYDENDEYAENGEYEQNDESIVVSDDSIVVSDDDSIVISDDSILVSDDEPSATEFNENAPESTEAELMGELIVPESLDLQLAISTSSGHGSQSTDNPLFCASCSTQFLGSQAYQTHQIECAGSMTKYRAEMWSCGYCSRLFNWQRNLHKHLRLFHASTNLAMVKPATQLKQMHIWYCTVCFYTSVDHGNGLRHVFMKHNTKDETLLRPIQDWPDPAEQQPNDGQPMTCDYCTARFTEISRLRLHQRTKHPNKLLANHITQCNKCPAQYDKFSLYQIHLMRAHGVVKKEFIDRLECIECGLPFRLRNLFIIHMRKHDIRNSYVCCIESCDDTFETLDLLAIHLVSHPLSETLHTCDWCQRDFTVQQFRWHKCSQPNKRKTKENNGSIWQPCQYCHKIILLRGMRSHLRLHNIYGGHECGVCSRSFYRMGDLRRHQITHGHDNATTSAS